jgi:AraC-like DNA-binding protein
VDALTDLLDGVRARGALFGQAIMEPPWALRFATGAPLTITTMLRGEAWVVPAEGEAVRIGPGDLAVVAGTAPHVVADAPATPLRYEVHTPDYCSRADGTEARIALDVRTCGEDPDGSALLLSGAYDRSGGISERLLSWLPPVLVLAADECPDPGPALLAAQIDRDLPGQQVVLDRVLDLVLVSVLRSWFGRAGVRPPWYRSTGDPVVDHALRLLHADPAHPWTVAALAAVTGVSRAAFARRFTERVGTPPMTYLGDWRIGMAADLLRESDDTVGAVARKVGYADVFSLSTAFKRRRGTTPTEHRASSRDRLNSPSTTGRAEVR